MRSTGTPRGVPTGLTPTGGDDDGGDDASTGGYKSGKKRR